MGEAEIKAAVVAVLTGGASLFAWSVKRWVSRIEASLERIGKDLGELKLTHAVSAERHAHLVGGIDVLRESVSSTNQSVGTLSTSVEKLWAVLAAKKLVEPRLSDDVLKGRRG